MPFVKVELRREVIRSGCLQALAELLRQTYPAACPRSVLVGTLGGAIPISFLNIFVGLQAGLLCQDAVLSVQLPKRAVHLLPSYP